MQRDLYSIALLEFLDHGFDVELTRARKQELLGLRVAIEVKRRGEE